MTKSKKLLIASGVLLTSLSFKAKKTGKSLKEYFYEEETIKHISLVLYDLLPLSVKIGMRYQKFHEIFEGNFKGIRNALLGEEVVKEKTEEVMTPVLKKNITPLVEVEKKAIRKPRKSAVKKISTIKKVKKNEE